MQKETMEYKSRCGVEQGGKVLAFWGEETNRFANGETCNNGGGYYQPAGGISAVLDDGTVCIVEYEDSSCGDFGTRKYMSVTIPGYCWDFSWGSMHDASNMSDEEFDECSRSMEGMLGIGFYDFKEAVEYWVRKAAYPSPSYDEENSDDNFDVVAKPHIEIGLLPNFDVGLEDIDPQAYVDFMNSEYIREHM